jgi:hypothetical protein
MGLPIAANTWLGCISADLQADPESTEKPASSNAKSRRSASTDLIEIEICLLSPDRLEAISTSLIWFRDEINYVLF